MKSGGPIKAVFSISDIYSDFLTFLNNLGYSSSRRVGRENFAKENISEIFNLSNLVDKNVTLQDAWEEFFLLFQLTQADLFPDARVETNNDSLYQSYLFYALNLKGGKNAYDKNRLERIALELNRAFMNPLFLLIKHGSTFSLLITSRRENKKDQNLIVIEQVFSIIGIDPRYPTQAELEILEKISLPEIRKSGWVHSIADLQTYWEEAFASMTPPREAGKRKRADISPLTIFFRDVGRYPMMDDMQKVYYGLTANPALSILGEDNQPLWHPEHITAAYQKIIENLYTICQQEYTPLAGCDCSIIRLTQTVQNLKTHQGRVDKELIEWIDYFAAETTAEWNTHFLRIIISLYLLPADTAACIADAISHDVKIQFNQLQHDSCILKQNYDIIESLSLEARKQLVKSNLRLAVSRARKKQMDGVTLQDLIQEGCSGLMRAAEGYDFSQGTQFTTYATYWIDQRIIRFIANHSRIIRLPVHLHDSINKLIAIQEKLLQKLGRDPTMEEIAVRSELVPKSIKGMMDGNPYQPKQLNKEELETVRDAARKVERYLKYNLPVLSLDESRDHGESTLGDIIPDKRSLQFIEDIDQKILRTTLDELILGRLDERDARILKSRLGYDDDCPQTLEAIAEVEGVTHERIRQIESRCIKKARGYCHRNRITKERFLI